MNSSLSDDPHAQDKDWAVIQEARRLAETRTERERYLMQKCGKKIYLGHEGPDKHEGWTGELPFYLYWCQHCEHWAKDYPHGFEDRQRLACPNCQARESFVSFKTKLKVFWGTIWFIMVGSRMSKQNHKKEKPEILMISGACEKCGKDFERQTSSDQVVWVCDDCRSAVKK